jgi:predicted MFS family arabinose efflux permease
MSTFASTPGARLLLGSSILARLPLPMLGIGLLVHAQQLTGSFAAAGLVAAAYAAGTGIGGPVLGRLVDGRGQTAVLAPSALASTALLAVVAVLPHGAALGLLVALAAGIGLATPPLGACVRTLLPGLLPDAEAARVAYAVDATAVELTWIFGPPLALGLGALLSTGAAVAVAGGVLLLGTAAFAAQPVSRGWRPAPSEGPRRGGSMRAPGMRTLVCVLVAVGLLFGAVEVAVTAAAEGLASASAAGPLLGVWGIGSLAGGVVATRLGGGAHSAAGLVWMLAALAVGHVALVGAAGSIVAMAATLLVAGAAIAPTFASVYAMVDRVAPSGTVTEAFAWLATALAVGSAAGAASAGPLAEHLAPTAAFVLAAGAGVVAMLVTALRAHTLDGPTAPVVPIADCVLPAAA